MRSTRAERPIAEELPRLMNERGWRPIDVYAHGGPTPATVSRYQNEKRGLVAEPRVLRTLRKFEHAFDLPEGYFLEERVARAEGELRFLLRGGFISLDDLEGLLEVGRRAQREASSS